MTVSQIEYFLTAAETLNFTKAASRLFVTQQVISRQIRLLEEDLGVTLFQRNGRHISLTAGGRLLYETWSRHRSETNAALSEARLLGTENQKIRLGIAEPDSIIDCALPKIQLLNIRFPNITWDYFLGNFAQVEHAMDRSEIDLAVTLSTELSPDHPKAQSLLLKDLKLCIFVGSAHPLYGRQTLTISDLKNETFFILSEEISYGSSDYVLTDCKLAGYTPRGIRYFSDLNQLEFALLSGKGIFVGYDIMFHSSGAYLKAFPIPVREGMQKSDLIVAWRYPQLESYAQVFYQA